MSDIAVPAGQATLPEQTGDPHATSTGVSNEKLAMWLFLGSDCLLFGALISTYLLLRHRMPSPDVLPQGVSADVLNNLPTPEEIFDIPFTSVSSFVLLMSSLTMALAVGAIHRGDVRRCRTWLMTTAMLGATFIAGQVYEFTTFVNEGLGYRASEVADGVSVPNIFGTAFYTLTGFHGVHVSVGIVFLMSLFVMSLRGHLGPDRAETVEIFGLYWHFVDIVWIIIFTVVYLIP